MGIKEWWNSITKEDYYDKTISNAVFEAKLNDIRYSSPYETHEQKYERKKKILLRVVSQFLNERKDCTKYELEEALNEFQYAARAVENMAGCDDKSPAKRIVEQQLALARNKVFALVFCTKDMSAEAVEAFIKGLESDDDMQSH